jgi:hypothetical protein
MFFNKEQPEKVDRQSRIRSIEENQQPDHSVNPFNTTLDPNPWRVNRELDEEN